MGQYNNAYVNYRIHSFGEEIAHTGKRREYMHNPQIWIGSAYVNKVEPHPSGIFVKTGRYRTSRL